MTTDINRIARTESLFRDVNERISEVADRLGSDDAEFVCECADPDCSERVGITLHEYEQVRADGVRFLVVPGHEEPAFEHVLKRRGSHDVIAKSKNPRLARAARELDPRDDDEQSADQASEIT
jgi:hypothetical protein